jgi:hypothetical protein
VHCIHLVTQRSIEGSIEHCARYLGYAPNQDQKRHVRQRQCRANGIRGKKCTAGSLIISSFYDANTALVGGCKSRGKWVLLRARNKFVGLSENSKRSAPMTPPPPPSHSIAGLVFCPPGVISRIAIGVSGVIGLSGLISISSSREKNESSALSYIVILAS